MNLANSRIAAAAERTAFSLVARLVLHSVAFLMLTYIGRRTLSTLSYFGEVALLARDALVSMVRAPIRWRLVMEQIAKIGAGSQLIVAVTGIFTGAVFAAQLYFQMHKFGMDATVGSVTAISLFRELGPALTGLMVAGRVGASMAAEIGTMKVTEQVDALRALGVHPVDYLVVPRALATMISMPLLVALACALGVVASYIVAVPIMGIAHAPYMRNLTEWVQRADVYKAMLKGGAFGTIIAFVGCREGLNAENGAEGVGRAPTEAVVTTSLAILIMNFVLTFGLNILFPVK